MSPLGSKNVLVTGGAGFIGANVVRSLVGRGYCVTVLDDLSTGVGEYLNGLPIALVEGDITDARTVEKCVEGQAGIVHLAALAGVTESLTRPWHSFQVNVIGTLNVLMACRDLIAGGETPARVVFASSNAALGRQSPPATEDKAPLPVSPYGASKAAGEAYCLSFDSSWQVGTVALRFGNVYGPFSAQKESVVAKFFKDIAARGSIMIEGDGNQTRDFIYVGDICDAIVKALESSAAGQVFQIATGVESSILQLAQRVQATVSCPVQVDFGLSRPGDVRRNYSTTSKAERLLGWRPTTSLRDGLAETWEWFDSWSAKSPVLRR